MEAICYICNNRSKKWTQNLVGIKSKHSSTPITEFVSKFLDDYRSDRNLYNPTNCICSDCLSKIYAYDWTCTKAREQEKELRTLLLKTESTVKSLKIRGHAEDRIDTNETLNNDPTNPLNGVVQIIDDEDYSNGGRMDDNKGNVQNAMREFPSSEAAKSTTRSKIPATSVVKIEKSSPNVDIKPEPSTMCDIKPTMKMLPQQGKNVTSKVEPPKKGKPIIVRVVKRVPFLKSNPSQTNSTATNTTPSSSANIAVTPNPTPKMTTKMSPVKNTAADKQLTTCKFCDARFPDARILQNHLKLHVKHLGSITCHICFYRMNGDKESFKDHVKMHSKEPMNHCVLCPEGDAEGFDLRQHVQTNHNEASPNLLCDFCGKTFATSAALSKHRKSHSGDDNLEQCPHCPKTFKWKRSLKDHISTHLNTEPAFACAYCDRRFKRKDHLRAHERRHRGDNKKFKCTLCEAAFEFKHDFNLHLQRKHDAELPHNKRR